MLESENSKKSTPIAITNQGGSDDLMETFYSPFFADGSVFALKALSFVFS